MIENIILGLLIALAGILIVIPVVFILLTVLNAWADRKLEKIEKRILRFFRLDSDADNGDTFGSVDLIRRCKMCGEPIPTISVARSRDMINGVTAEAKARSKQR